MAKAHPGVQLVKDVHRKPRRGRGVVIISFASRRGIERKALKAYLERCGVCGDEPRKHKPTYHTNVGWRCGWHRPKGDRSDAMFVLRTSSPGRWA